ncbi:ABC transporter substrate-binding protein [Bradyrhizobium guangdongense]|uniref:substrate-binding periplasmic protein n=1 Tax=Bradyrhizobium guangdongense TaxID=1325090 RepID=UPI00112CC866|nr:transporter substrate-binding domain-containing protein [Bradyrhizobium guangdongense]TPQ31799.1 ABC transporter substrate-binding protein [Bradyrhizobium guangdongense]
MKIILLFAIGAVLGLSGPAQARTLEAIRSDGKIGLCAHPNSLPFASKAGNPPGFQVELGQALARELGIALRLDWIITQYQMRSANCDILLDIIADREAQGETRLRISKPYYRSGVALAVPSASALTSFKSLNEQTKVGVQVGSVAAMIINRRRVPISTFGFESDSLDALANREIDAAAVTPTAASYFNLTHPDKPVRILDRDESEADLNWNVAVGMLRPDDALRDAIDGALERLRADGTIDRIYRRYGIVLQAPR